MWGGRVSIPMHLRFTDVVTCPEHHPIYDIKRRIRGLNSYCCYTDSFSKRARQTNIRLFSMRKEGESNSHSFYTFTVFKTDKLSLLRPSICTGRLIRTSKHKILSFAAFPISLYQLIYIFTSVIISI